jgi:hypothetical protein
MESENINENTCGRFFIKRQRENTDENVSITNLIKVTEVLLDN